MFLEGLNRFSEDLDFTVEDDFDAKSLVERVLEDLEYMGVHGRSRKVNDTWSGASFKISVEGPLFTRDIEMCHVKIEFGTRERVMKKPVGRFIDSTYPDILPFTVLLMDPEELLAEKVRALITREKARDAYDIWFLLGLGWKTRKEIVDSKLSYYEEAFSETVLKDSLKRKEGIWNSELRPLVFGKLPDFDAVRREILDGRSWVL